MAYSLADTLLTVISRRSNCGTLPDKATLVRVIPEGWEVKNQTKYGVKTYPVLQKSAVGDVRVRPMVFCIAGSVALGLHSLIHLEARLTGTPLMGSLDELLHFVVNTLREFWDGAFDKDIEYLFAITDNNQLHLYKIVGDRNTFDLLEIARTHGLLFGIIGDGVEEVNQQILQEAQSLCVAGISTKPALFTACVRALKRSINDPNIWTVGGGIQACMMNGNKVENLLVCVAQGECYYRGAKLSGTFLQETGEFGLGGTGSGVLLLDHIRYDPNVRIEVVAERFND